MAVRKSERRRLRRELISRTARVWSRLNRNLVKELNKVAQDWIKKLSQDIETKFPEKFTKILKRNLREALAYGYWLQYLYLYELRGKKYRGKIKLAEGDSVKENVQKFMSTGEWNEVIPEDAVKWINNYVPTLSGNFSHDILEKTRDVIKQSLLEGTTLQERMKALQEVLDLSKSRIETIARTEITRADTLGRLTSMKANDDVIGFEFSAIMDDRTTDICASRHGLVMRLDDPRLPENTPPLHVNCRSLLLSLTIYDYPDGLLTSHEFDEIPPGIQRPEDIEEVQKILTKELTLEEKIQELYDKNTQYQLEYDNLQKSLQDAVNARDIKRYDEISKQQSDILDKMREIDKRLYPLKIEAADKGIIFTSRLEEKLNNEDIQAIHEIVKNAPEGIRRVWNLYEDQMKITDTHEKKGFSHYSPEDNGIHINMLYDKNLPYNLPDYRTFFHELGHLIDNASGHSFMYYMSQDSQYDLYNTLKSEVNDYVNTTLLRLKKKNLTIVKKSEAYLEISHELRSLPIRLGLGLSDVFGGATLNKIQPYDAPTHTTKYWRDNPEYISLEFFAETFSSSLVNPEAIETVRQYLPKSYAIFDKIIQDIAMKGN